MRTTQIELFSIDELGANQEKAIDKLRELDYFGCDSSTLQSEFEETLKEYGFPTDNIEWSLSWSQGDGVAFYGDIDIEAMLKKLDKEWNEQYEFLLNRYGLTAVSMRNSYGSHYSHWNTMDVYMERDREYANHAHRVLGVKLWELVRETVISVSRELEKRGYEIIDAHQTKEHIIEHAMLNELEFRADGRIWNG